MTEHEKLAERFLNASFVNDWTLSQFADKVLPVYAQQLGIPVEKFSREFREAFDWGPLVKSTVSGVAASVPEPVLQAAVAFYESAEGVEFVRCRRSLETSLAKGFSVACMMAAKKAVEKLKNG